MIMNTFHLQIVTPDGLMFDGDAEKLLVRTTEGDVGIMSGHCDYVTPVDTGEARVTTNCDVRTAACSGCLLYTSHIRVFFRHFKAVLNHL